MILGVTDRAVDIVGEGIDCALRIGELPDSTSIARPIAMATVVACATPEYLHEHGEPQTLDDLASHHGVNFLSGQSNRTLPWHFSIKGQDRAFENNAGITVAQHLDSVSLVEILRRHRPAPRPVALRYPSRAHWALAAGSRLLSVVRGSHRPKVNIRRQQAAMANDVVHCQVGQRQFCVFLLEESEKRPTASVRERDKSSPSSTQNISRTPMKYDDASWHNGGDFPAGQPQEHGGTHIALFMRWCFVRGWAGDFHVEEEPEAVARVISGELSATEFLFRYCDGKFTEEDLNDAGNAIAQHYYGSRGLYLHDYADHFGNLMYVAPESAHDFEEFSAMLDARVKSGVLIKAET